MVPKKEEAELLLIDGHEVKITNPRKLYFRAAGITKLDVVQYFLSVAPGALLGIRDRPLVLKRFVDGAEGPPFYQKRAPANLPPWMRTVTLHFPSGRTADELVVDDAAGLAWATNTGNIELHPHPVLTGDLDHPNELRVDLDPGPGVEWSQVRTVALEVRAFLEELGMVGWVKTSGSRGMHINVRIEQRWGFQEVRRAALALARAIERRVPQLATSKWWKEERHGVFIDYNQNAKDRTTAAAYSVRPLPDARVSAPLEWSEVPDADPADFTLRTVPERFRTKGDPHAKMNEAVCSLDALLEQSLRDEAEGLGDAPWPPMYAKQEGEAKRAPPSKRRAPASAKKAPRSKMPLIVIANANDKATALEGLERWKARHPEAAKHLAVDDVLVDSMRGRAYTWTRIRVNLRNVPDELRPPQEKPDPDEEITR